MKVWGGKRGGARREQRRRVGSPAGRVRARMRRRRAACARCRSPPPSVPPRPAAPRVAALPVPRLEGRGEGAQHVVDDSEEGEGQGDEPEQGAHGQAHRHALPVGRAAVHPHRLLQHEVDGERKQAEHDDLVGHLQAKEQRGVEGGRRRGVARVGAGGPPIAAPAPRRPPPSRLPQAPLSLPASPPSAQWRCLAPRKTACRQRRCLP